MNREGRDTMNQDFRMEKGMMTDSAHPQESDILASSCVVTFSLPPSFLQGLVTTPSSLLHFRIRYLWRIHFPLFSSIFTTQILLTMDFMHSGNFSNTLISNTLNLFLPCLLFWYLDVIQFFFTMQYIEFSESVIYVLWISDLCTLLPFHLLFKSAVLSKFSVNAKASILSWDSRLPTLECILVTASLSFSRLSSSVNHLPTHSVLSPLMPFWLVPESPC